MSPVDLDTIRRAIREEAAAVPPLSSGPTPRPDSAASHAPPAGPPPWSAAARLPILGPALRWLHGLAKAPARIRDLHQMSRVAAARADRLQGLLEAWRDESRAATRSAEERLVPLAAEIAAVRAVAARGGEEARQATARTDSLLVALEAWRDLSRAATHRAEARLDALAEEAARALAEVTRVSDEDSRARDRLAARLGALAPRLDSIEAWREREDPASIPGAEDLLALVATRFRGGEELITKRLQAHLPLLTTAPAVTAGGAVLDLGCGRGEWLAVLKAAGVKASGVDTSEAAVRHCREAGLTATRDDLIEALVHCPAGTLGAVTAIQVVEHLPYAVVIRLIDEARGALAPGGLLLLETPNPDNLRVAASDFRLDPTHRQPLPSRLLALLVEARGFVRVSVRDLHPLEPPQGATLDPTVGAALWGPQDYAVVGWKPANDSSAADSSRATTPGA